MNAPFVTDSIPASPVAMHSASTTQAHSPDEPRAAQLCEGHEESLWPPRLALLAGGVANRLRPLTNSTPKSLIEVAGEHKPGRHEP